MSITDALRAGVDAAFNAVGDQVTTIRYYQYVTTEYEPSTDTTSVVSKSFFVSAIFTQYTSFERLTFGIDEKEQKVLIKQEELPVEPTNLDWLSYVRNGVSTVYTVEDHEDPGGGVIWQIRGKRK